MYFDRPINRNLWAIALIIVCIVLIGVAAGVLALNRQEQAINLIKVPADYPTIQAAINAAKPGDIIQVGTGIYAENVSLDRAVTLTAVTFDAANPVNNTTVIDGGAGTATITIAPNLTQMPIVRGFVIQGGLNGIQASSPFVAELNFFNSSGIQANYQWGSGGANRNNVYFKAGDDAIHLDAVDRPLLIENNRIMYAGDDGIEVNLQDKPSPPAPMEFDIWNNMIIGSGEDGIQFIDYPGDPQDTNRDFVLVGNLIANSQKAGIGLMPNGNTVEDYSGADILEAIRVINNTIYGNNHGISGGDNLVAINNIITHSPGRGVWKVQGPPGANAAVAYSLFFNNAVDADQTTLGAGIISGQDPLFAAPPNPGPDGTWGTVDDDFSGLLLQGTSPAIDKGVTQYAAADGELIPPAPLTGFLGAAPDLGWREFGSPIVITPTASPIPSPTSITPTLAPTLTFTPIPPTATVVTLTPVPTSTVAPATPTVPTSTVPATVTSPAIVSITPTPQLNVLSVTPNNAPANTSVNVTLTGTAFANGAAVAFEGGQGTAPQVAAIQVVNANTIVISVNTTMDAGLGTQVWDIRVTNPNGASVVLPDAFTVTVTP